jgi:putative ABC transport system substrate-binding protein
MNRRSFVTMAGAGLLAAAGAPHAQPTTRVYRLGVLRPTMPPSDDPLADGIPRALAELGYVAGRNLVLEQRFSGGDAAALPQLARELAALNVDAIVAVGTAAARAAKAATATIPVIIYGNFDPVASGLVASLGRPGGNVTGVLIAADGTLAVKKVELLKEAVPRLARVALLAPVDPGFALQMTEVRKAAAALRIELVVAEVRGGDFEPAFAAITAAKCGAMIVGATTFFTFARKRIIELAVRHRLPAIYEWPEQVHDGGLMSYGGSLVDTYRRLAVCVDRILKGASPSELPVDQQSKFRLVINRGAARAIGLTIPQSLLLRADEVIQ